MRTLSIAMLLLAAGLAGCIGDDEPARSTSLATDDPQASGLAGPLAVLAFIDTGINPYHADFRDDSPRASEHPSTYLDDYPQNATALNLTLDQASLEAAVAADCQTWEDIQRGELYWVPGTRIVGMTAPENPWTDSIQGDGFSCDDAEEGWPPFIQEGWHGSYVASRGAGNAYGACNACLIVAVQNVIHPPSSAVWAVEQPWIDAQSNSWAWQDDAGVTEAMEAAAQEQPLFMASGNTGVAELISDHYVRTPSVIRVGGHDSGRVITSPGPSPQIVADACGAWIADHYGMEEVRPTGFGTSFASPFAAGIAGELVLEARLLLKHNRTGVQDGVLAQGTPGALEAGPLADGEFTMEELKRVLLATAEPRPEAREEDGAVCEAGSETAPPTFWSTPVEWSRVPEGPAGIPLIGYGAVTSATAEHALQVLHGTTGMPERSEEGAYFELDQARRETVHDVWTDVGR